MNVELDIFTQVQAIREGGHTERAHTVPHVGSYNVANHTWHVVCLILLLCPRPSMRLIKAAQFHDVVERYAGDIPGHAKYWHSPELGRYHKKLEKVLNERLNIHIELTPYEECWLKGCDILEFYLWCCDQVAMGNQHVLGVRNNVKRYISENPKNIPRIIIEFINGYSWERTPDTGFWEDARES